MTKDSTHLDQCHHVGVVGRNLLGSAKWMFWNSYSRERRGNASKKSICDVKTRLVLNMVSSGVFIYTHTCTCTHPHKPTHTHTHVHTHIHTPTHPHTHTHTHTHTPTPTHTHPHTHTHKPYLSVDQRTMHGYCRVFSCSVVHHWEQYVHTDWSSGDSHDVKSYGYILYHMYINFNLLITVNTC